MGAVHDPGARRLVVAITGASGPQFGIRLLQVLADDASVETHLILSDSAWRTLELEVGTTGTAVKELADVVYDPGDYAAAVSSGSFRTMGMVVAPCSMSTLGAIASGVSTTLVARAADVTLKERRPLVLLARETPLNLIHLRNMVTVTEAGATVLPPVPAFYHSPETIEDLIDQTVGKVLDQFPIDHELFTRWRSPEGSRP
ncbi:MAG: UbiX family flavin prenyltransferase [Acidimicrobiales bacterium]|jgi:4-hydroxy-3-polyprenylbenzoate decarboxylase|nr:3-octaprenyl-4-hydroxybenzoate carboxy-lyase [Acidobacteriota bacterium]MCP4792533.1 UbiX family flavin prenyltransferase [Actinomycetes bacterium]MDP6106345.1 UbiX family flavin prenyltransferase [Acidimicrobiales bacterium]MDP6373183.1 UbiX family flavin prenyltransferase [Vicinamibacterales bacterium]MCP4844270.1 UbiX family flavin prenyltransferase [Actinomycetes bacterium]|tara:strand:+ start:8475 stop:9077 length:603 start_codon:yes stop_codon:yes gene_type:complete